MTSAHALVTGRDLDEWTQALPDQAAREAAPVPATVLEGMSFATTQQYAHFAPDAHRKVLELWSQRAATGGAATR